MSLLIPTISSDYLTIAEGEFTDVFGRDYKVEIEKKLPGVLTTTPEVLNLSASPVVITQHGSGSETESPIKAQDLSLTLNSVEDFQYINLYSGSNFDYRIKLIYSGSTIWMGYVIPDQWNEAFISPPYKNNVGWVDGLSMLKNFRVEDENGCYLSGRHTWLNFILWMLSKIDKGCILIDAINVLEERADETSLTTGFLADTIVDVEAFRGLSCYEALEKMLYPNYQITYASNKYTIRRIDQSQTYQGISYRYKGEYIATAVINPLTSLTCATEAQASRVVWVDGSQQLEIIPAAKKVEFTHKYGLKESIIPRSGFEACDFQQNGVPKSPWESLNVLKKEFADRVVAEMQANSNAYLEAIARPAYVAQDETFVVEIMQSFGTLGVPRESSGGRSLYYGPKGIKEIEGAKVTEKTPFIHLRQSDVRWRLLKEMVSGTLNSGDYIIFPGQALVKEDGYINSAKITIPPNYFAGVMYKVVGLQESGDFYVFDLSEQHTPESIIPNTYPGQTHYYYVNVKKLHLPVRLETDGGIKGLSQRGEFLPGMRIPMELPVNKKTEQGFFELGFESNPESDNQAGDGFIYFTIEKPRPIYQSETDSRVQGTYFIDHVKVYFKDQPEERKFTLQLSNKHNIVKEVEFWFGEIYKGVEKVIIDPNGILKFYNTLIFRDGSIDGKVSGKWKIRRGDDVELKQYSTIIREFFANLYLKPRYLLRGNIDSRIYLFGKTLTENATGKAYMINSAVWDVYMAHWDVELHEIGVADQLGAKAYSDGYDEGYD